MVIRVKNGQLWIFSWMILFLSLQFLYGQTTPATSSGMELLNNIRSDPGYISNRMNRDSRIEGTPYLVEDFKDGAVYYNRKKYVNLDLRYNYHEGYFEYKEGETIKYFSPLLTRFDSVWLGDDLFIYVEYMEGNHSKHTFMKVIFSGGVTSLLLFQEVTLLQAEPPKGYAAAKPARFKTAPDEYYIKRGREPVIEFRGKKSIPDLFPDRQKELERFVKENGLRLKNQEELIELCRYYETLE